MACFSKIKVTLEFPWGMDNDGTFLVIGFGRIKEILSLEIGLRHSENI